MQARSASAGRVTADVRRDTEGKPRVFTLRFEGETVVLDPGMPWVKADAYKWVARGIIEQPQSFHVQADGTVEINGEKIGLPDAEGTAKLALEVNKHHDLPGARKESAPAIAPGRATAAAPPPDRVVFHVTLDQLGHLHIDCIAGEERTATSMRGLPSLIQNGLMLKPGQLHVDPLQRNVEIDEVCFECSEAGARQLETALNSRYAPSLRDRRETPIQVRENPASPTAFDIRFEMLRAGARVEVKGHLSQDKLDILQDQTRCNLLKPGILLRLAPPFLIVRRRRPDGGEEQVPELPDLQYLRANVGELQQLLNHPLVRRGAGPAIVTASVSEPAELVALRVCRGSQSQLPLWLQFVRSKGGTSEGYAFTHHNLAELQHAGTFLPHLDVTLSLDNKRLSVLNRDTGEEQHIIVEYQSADDDLARAGQMLTACLRPPLPPKPVAGLPVSPPASVVEPLVADSQAERLAPAAPAPVEVRSSEPNIVATRSPAIPVVSATASQDTPKAPPSLAVQSPPLTAPLDVPGPVQQDMVAERPAAAPDQGHASDTERDRFPAPNPPETVRRVFQAVVEASGLRVQDAYLSLPFAFTDRRFEILSFDDRAIESVLDLRSEDFAGFYLTHLSEQNVLLVYATRGRHIEFGPQRCELQASVPSEPDEFKGHGLLGLAQDRAGNFIFVVTPEFRAWVKLREKPYQEAGARFLASTEIATSPKNLVWIWPRDEDAERPGLDFAEQTSPGVVSEKAPG